MKKSCNGLGTVIGHRLGKCFILLPLKYKDKTNMKELDEWKW